MGDHLFVYGTLQLPDVMHAVTRLRPAPHPAVLSGFARFTLRGEVYPSVVPSPGARTEGMLYRDLDAATFDILDRFEGQEYERHQLSVSVHAETVQAWTYALRPPLRDRLSDEPWSLDEFVVEGLQTFLDGYAGFDRSASEGAP